VAEWVRLPSLGANVPEALVGTWHVREGERVRADEPLVEVITSKATFDLSSPAEGILLKVLAPEKSTVPVGFVLGVVGSCGEDVAPAIAENRRVMEEFRQRVMAGDLPAVRIRATPGARSLARSEGIDLGDVPPGPAGVIREEDVRRFIAFRRTAG